MFFFSLLFLYFSWNFVSLPIISSFLCGFFNISSIYILKPSNSIFWIIVDVSVDFFVFDCGVIFSMCLTYLWIFNCMLTLWMLHCKNLGFCYVPQEESCVFFRQTAKIMTNQPRSIVGSFLCFAVFILSVISQEILVLSSQDTWSLFLKPWFQRKVWGLYKAPETWHVLVKLLWDGQLLEYSSFLKTFNCCSCAALSSPPPQPPRNKHVLGFYSSGCHQQVNLFANLEFTLYHFLIWGIFCLIL